MVVMKGFLPRRGIGLCLLGVDNPSTYEDFCTKEVLFGSKEEGGGFFLFLREKQSDKNPLFY
jgi:hypothetical protein